MLKASTFRTLYESLSERAELTTEAFELLVHHLQPVSLKKKQHWLRPGDTCDSIAFINTGCVRIYFPREGMERSAQFFFQKAWVTDYESLHNNQVSVIGIDAIEDSELLVIKATDIDRMYKAFPELERVGRLIAEETVVNLCNRYRSLLNDTPLDRYTQLLEQRPEMVVRIPQHYIASYLGIEPESLSRIRKKIAFGCPEQISES